MAAQAAKDVAQKAVQATKKLGETAAKMKLRKRNLFELMYERPNNGLGEKFTRARWKMPGWFWTVTRIKKTIDEPGFKRGIAFGVLTKNGVPETRERKVRSASKREWWPYDENFYKKFDDPRYIKVYRSKAKGPPREPLHPGFHYF